MYLEIYLGFCLIVVVSMLLASLKALLLFKPIEKKPLNVVIVSLITSILQCFIPIYNIVQLIGFVFIILAMPNRLYDLINKDKKQVEWRD